jgi:tRNA(Ile)-lysidine synthase
VLNIFTNQIEKVFLGKKLPKKIAVAISGGCDSLALTLLLKDFCAAKKIELIAVTIDHKMRKTSSNEALELTKILTKEKISHQILTIAAAKIPQKNIEANLRQSRYEMLYEFCLEEKIEFLFLGHHAGDAAENFLIRLFRGSGLDGLSTIAELSDYKKIKLVRPLLNFDKDFLKKFLKEKKIKWFEDESNKDEKFLRNKIRNFLETFPEKNLIQARIKSAADEIAKTRDFFDELLLIEAKKILKFNRAGFCFLNLKKLQKTNPKFALKILALMAMEVSQQNYKPRLKELKIFYEYLLKNDKIKPRNFYGCSFEQLNEKLVLARPQRQLEDFYFRTILRKIKPRSAIRNSGYLHLKLEA